MNMLRSRSPSSDRAITATYELMNRLAEFSSVGIPTLKSYEVANIPEIAFAYLLWARKQTNLGDCFNWKTLSSHEQARQEVIKELIFTETDHIHHLLSIVEIFIATLHGLQDHGLLLDVRPEKLFLNIPDILNTNLLFWNITFYPMLAETVTNNTPFNSEYLIAGFGHFFDLFIPYEKYVNEQAKAIDYLRSLSKNADFMTYLNWCHIKNLRNGRLKLSDILVKPMQRLTKYSLLIRRLTSYTFNEPEQRLLSSLEHSLRQYLSDINRSIRKREELERLEIVATTVDGYEVYFKDEEVDKCFRLYSKLDVKGLMVNCLPYNSRCLIYEGDLRFKDNHKEIDVRAILLTDMLLICKKISKPSNFLYKMVRPKYMLNKAKFFPKYSKSASPPEITSLIYIMVDDVGNSYTGFTLNEPSKDSNASPVLKIWEQKIREAQLTYELSVSCAKNPRVPISALELEPIIEDGETEPPRRDSEDIEHEARERVATMLHGKIPTSEHQTPRGSMASDSLDRASSVASSSRTADPHRVRYPLHRNSTSGSSKDSHTSSHLLSTSVASHDEPQPGPSNYNYKPGTAVEHIIVSPNPDEAVTSIIVNVVSESEPETVVPTPSPSSATPIVVLEPSLSGGFIQRSESAAAGSQNTLRVQTQNAASLGHSCPELSERSGSLRLMQSRSPTTVSERLYQSHQELLQRNRLITAQSETSLPPPLPTRVFRNKNKTDGESTRARPPKDGRS